MHPHFLHTCRISDCEPDSLIPDPVFAKFSDPETKGSKVGGYGAEVPKTFPFSSDDFKGTAHEISDVGVFSP